MNYKDQHSDRELQRHEAEQEAEGEQVEDEDGVIGPTDAGEVTCFGLTFWEMYG